MDKQKSRLEKLVDIADKYGIEEDTKQEAAHAKEEKQLSAKEAMIRKKKVLLQASESSKKKIEIMMRKEKKQYQTLLAQKSTAFSTLNEKVDTLKSKQLKIAELIEKAKKISDGSCQEILLKWEASNNKQMEI